MMPSKKAEEKAKDILTVTHVSVAEFLEVRNTVVTGLSTLQSALTDLSRSYIAHTNNLIGRSGGTTIDQLNFANALGSETGFFSGRVATPTVVPAETPAPEVKKRKRREHDKNAPKRALTPFFLFLQTARSQIANELGPSYTAKEVQDEGGKRWREMPEVEKEQWTQRYLINFARYKEQMRCYKAGLAVPDATGTDASHPLQSTSKTNATAKPSTIPASADSSSTSEDSADSDDSDDSSSAEEAPAAKKPSPTSFKKQKAKEPAGRKRTVESEPVLDPALRATEKKKSKKRAVDEDTRKSGDLYKLDDRQKKKKRKSGLDPQ